MIHFKRVRCAFFAALMLALFTCFLNGCGRRTGPQRIAVQGAILFDNQLLKAGRITFSPVEETKGPTAVATVTDGFYDFSPRTGPVLGKNKVQIEALPNLGFELDDEASYAKAAQEKNGQPVLPPQTIPAEYNARSTLIVTVSPQGEKKFDFTLEKSTDLSNR